jgi:type IV secretion system protein VirB9
MIRKGLLLAATVAAIFCARDVASAQDPTPTSPVLAQDGSLRFVYGGPTEASLTCRPLFVCDVVLQSGETVLNLGVGDSARWVIASAQAGPGGAQPHVFVKPTEAGLDTNLVITTTKRTYYVRIVSAPQSRYTRISFSYPEDEANAAAAALADQRQRDEEKAANLPLLPPDQLDRKYKIVGEKTLAPQRVYNDGVHSFIEYDTLPTEIPVVYGVAVDGSEQIVNYRLHDKTYIVDSLLPGFDLILNAGGGKHGKAERRVYIRHT